MVDVRIDSELVDTTAGRIEKKNTAIDDAFTQLKQAVDALNRNWDGTAAEAAVNAFGEIERGYRGPRKTSIDNVVRFLKESVAQSYTQTEAELDSKAAMFM